MLHSLTVICRDLRNIRDGEDGVLIYHVESPTLDHDTVWQLAFDARNEDCPVDDGDFEIAFAFAGDIRTAADWR